MRRSTDAGGGWVIHSEDVADGHVRTWSERNGEAMPVARVDRTWEHADIRRESIARRTRENDWAGYSAEMRAAGVTP